MCGHLLGLVDGRRLASEALAAQQELEMRVEIHDARGDDQRDIMEARAKFEALLQCDMARGGRHGDQRRLDDFMRSSEGWGNAEGRQLSAEQMESEPEMSEDEDAEEDVREQGGAAGARLTSPQPQAESQATGPSSSSAHNPGQSLK